MAERCAKLAEDEDVALRRRRGGEGAAAAAAAIGLRFGQTAKVVKAVPLPTNLKHKFRRAQLYRRCPFIADSGRLPESRDEGRAGTRTQFISDLRPPTPTRRQPGWAG
jgi:hypothetical protein